MSVLNTQVTKGKRSWRKAKNISRCLCTEIHTRILQASCSAHELYTLFFKLYCNYLKSILQTSVI